jgi:hypothetical protein
MPKTRRKPRKTYRRVMRGGAILPQSLGENNIDALNRINVGENNLAAIANLKMPKPPLQPTGQIVNIPAINYPVTGSVPLIDRARGYLKRTQIISRTARKLGANKVANFAEQYGYGRKKKRRKHYGGAAFVDRYGNYLHNF